ncbi:MAG TPA: IS3 family transposase [Candidatus Saccharimonadales bacterium]|nr:IS3 family transposase [Candidatus Saccharimonadales bacterium]
MGIARSRLYCTPTVRAARDTVAVHELLAVHEEHPRYGVRRLADELHWSQSKTRRIRTLAGVTIARRSKKYGKHTPPEIQAPQNALKQYAVFRDEARPQAGMDYRGMVNASAWVQDFTYLWVDRQYHYLAVVLDLKTRRVLGWKLGLRHTSNLTYTALLDALSRHPVPAILHSDQGSEYLSYKHKELCERLEITLSASTKASPWQNGYMERFFGTLKDELPPLSTIPSTEKLHEAIALTIHYYNHRRKHSALNNMTPAAYAARLMAATPLQNERDMVSGKSRA